MRISPGLTASALLIAVQATWTYHAADACTTLTLDSTLPSPTPGNFHFSGNVRKHYIAAEEEHWSYAPTGWDNYMGVPIEHSPRAKAAGYLDRLTWKKALYRGYTNESFTEQLERPASQGVLGPTIRAEVGDLIEIMFLNNLSANYASMHSMGLMYTKESEGGDYPNNTIPGQNSPFTETMAVSPGACVVYKWMVNDGAGPDLSYEPSKGHSYHSYVTMQEDTNAGLIGPSIIYARGQMEEVMATHREFPILYMSFDEHVSFMSKINNMTANDTSSGSDMTSGINNSASQHDSSCSSSATYSGSCNASVYPSSKDGGSSQGTQGRTGGSQEFSDLINADASYGNRSIWEPQLTNLLSSAWGNGATFYSLNGYVLANNPIFEACKNDNVIWYTYAYGSGSHVFHMHGNGFTENDHSMPSISINDGKVHTLVMTAWGIGQFEVICHVNNHNTFGMVANYRVYDGMCPLQPLGYNTSNDNSTTRYPNV